MGIAITVPTRDIYTGKVDWLWQIHQQTIAAGDSDAVREFMLSSYYCSCNMRQCCGHFSADGLQIVVPRARCHMDFAMLAPKLLLVALFSCNNLTPILHCHIQYIQDPIRLSVLIHKRFSSWLYAVRTIRL